jgi:integrase
MGRDIPINGTNSCAQKNDVHEVSSAACPTSVVLPLWAADRDHKPKPRSVRNKASKMKVLFTFLEKPDDLTKVTEDDLQRYKEHLLKVGGNNVASDHLKDIRSIFAVAKANKKITMDPAKELRVPPRRQKVIRQGFDDPATRRILEGADEREPIVRWGCWLGATLGLITSEFSDASCLDVKIIDDIPVLHIRPNHRIVIGEDGEQRGDLKTGFRPRTLPLHHKMAAGFLDHVEATRRQYGEDAGLFAYAPVNRDGVRTVNASFKIMKLIRDLGFGAPWCHYSFRHRVATILEGMPDVKPARQRYILGHARADVHETYMEHQPTVLKPIIDAISVG